MQHANYEIIKEGENNVIIRDIGPWDRHPTVTNDAEFVVGELAELLGKRRLFYYDSGNDLYELLVKDGRFNGWGNATK